MGRVVPGARGGQGNGRCPAAIRTFQFRARFPSLAADKGRGGPGERGTTSQGHWVAARPLGRMLWLVC